MCLHVRRRDLVALTVATVVTGAAVFVALDKRGSGTPATASTPQSTASSPAAASPPAVLASLDSTAPVPADGEVAAALDAAMASFPADDRLAGTVVDVASGTSLWSHDEHAAMAPASTTKLLTATAALSVLGPDFRFTTTTKAVGDTVYLVGGGDPTLVRTSSSPVIPAYPQPASLADLAAQTASDLPPGVAVKLRIDTSAWSGPKLAKGWSSDYVSEGDVTPPSALELNGGRLHPDDFDSPRSDDPARQAAKAFVALLRSDGVDVSGSPESEPAPPAAITLGSVSSPPLSALVERLLTESDNDLAEALGRALATHDGLPADFTGAASAVTREIVALGVPMASATLYDTSGLSHDDRLDPATLAAVLRAAAASGHPRLAPVVAGLPVAGFTGTLADRYRGHGATPGAGVVRAKTGTLVGVDSLAGLVVDGGGRLLAFAFLASGSGMEDPVERGLDRIAAGLAAVG